MSQPVILSKYVRAGDSTRLLLFGIKVTIDWNKLHRYMYVSTDSEWSRSRARSERTSAGGIKLRNTSI